MGPAVVEVTPGAGALPKEISMGFRGLANGWTDGQSLGEKVVAPRQAGVASALSAAALPVGVSLCLGGISAKGPSSLTFTSGLMNPRRGQ